MAHAQKPDFVFRAKRTSPFKSAWGASVQSTAGSRGVRNSGSNAGYTMFRDSVKGYWLPTAFASFPFTSSFVRHCVPSHFNWSLINFVVKLFCKQHLRVIHSQLFVHTRTGNLSRSIGGKIHRREVKRVYWGTWQVLFNKYYSNRQIYQIWVWQCIYSGADKSLARPGRKQANDSVRMAWISFGALHVLSILQGCW